MFLEFGQTRFTLSLDKKACVINIGYVLNLEPKDATSQFIKI